MSAVRRPRPEPGTVTDPGYAERQKFREAAQVGYWNEFFGKFPDTKPVAEKVLAVQ